MGLTGRRLTRIARLTNCCMIGAIAAVSALVPASVRAQAASGESVFRVEARAVDGTARQGSAVAIGRDTLVTNCHVTRRAATIMVARGGRTFRATVRAGSSELDLCVLSAPFAVASAPRLRDAGSVAVGEPVQAAGYGGGHGLTVSAGAVTALHRHENSSVIQVSAPFDFGASGGGLFDRDGNLVGVLTFKVVGGERSYFAVPTDWIARVMAVRSDDAPAFWERAPGALPAFLSRIVLAPEGRRG